MRKKFLNSNFPFTSKSTIKMDKSYLQLKYLHGHEMGCNCNVTFLPRYSCANNSSRTFGQCYTGIFKTINRNINFETFQSCLSFTPYHLE